MQRHNETQRLKWALIISGLYFFAELIAGFITNSLALLSDAGHMLSDIGALSLSLFAFRMARRPATLQSTYGYHRIEILAPGDIEPGAAVIGEIHAVAALGQTFDQVSGGLTVVLDDQDMHRIDSPKKGSREAGGLPRFPISHCPDCSTTGRRIG